MDPHGIGAYKVLRNHSNRPVPCLLVVLAVIRLVEPSPCPDRLRVPLAVQTTSRLVDEYHAVRAAVCKRKRGTWHGHS